MGPWIWIVAGFLVALTGLVAVVEVTRNPGTRAAPRRAAEAIPDIRGSMSLAAERYPFTVALEAAHEDPWAGLGHDPWAELRDDSYGWTSGACAPRRDGQNDAWRPAPHDPAAFIDPALAGIAARYNMLPIREDAQGRDVRVCAIDSRPAAGADLTGSLSSRPHEEDPGSLAHGEPGLTRLADTGDVMNAHQAAEYRADLLWQDADRELFLATLAGRHGLAVSRD